MAKEKIKETVADEYEELTLEDRVINIEKKVNWTFGLAVVITIISVLILIFISTQKHIHFIYKFSICFCFYHFLNYMLCNICNR